MASAVVDGHRLLPKQPHSPAATHGRTDNANGVAGFGGAGFKDLGRGTVVEVGHRKGHQTNFG
jgi:hypothetical protein